MKEYLGIIVVAAVAVLWVAMRIVGKLASKQPSAAQPMSSHQLGSELDTSRVHRPLSSPVEWLTLIAGFGMVGFGILARLGIFKNPFYQQIWWLLVILGIGAMVWSISTRRT